jgi:hypothetical protein
MFADERLASEPIVRKQNRRIFRFAGDAQIGHECPLSGAKPTFRHSGGRTAKQGHW